MLIPRTQLGRYTIRQHLGAGGMGDVYVAHDPTLDRLVAVKVLAEALAADAGRLSRFVREARAASSLNHPSILTVFDFGEQDGIHFLVTELVDGSTLREWSAEKRPPLGDVLEVMAQVAAALGAAHAAGIVHRDVKPENLMLRSDGFVKVLDFGIAKLLTAAERGADAHTDPNRQTMPGTILGTTRYMSPEQALGTAVDARSDVWSLGVVLYELLAGKPPFAAQTPMGTLAMIMGREPEPLDTAAPCTPEPVCAVVARALRKQPAERFSTGTEMAAELRRAARELETGAAVESEAKTATLAPAVGAMPQAPATNLPASLSPIVGREREVEEIIGLLRAPAVRLVTLTGPGGTGKTRLALEVATALVAEFRDGVFAVDLSALSDASLVAAHVGHALGVREADSAEMSELLSRHLSERELLLVLDSFEHLLEAAPLVATLIGAASGLKVLATSRAPLHLRHEREVAVEPLAVPEFGSLPPLDELERAGAVTLFVERAREAKASFALTVDNARAVVEICRRLDGLPLAIELAAARVKLFAPAALLGKLEHRLKLLTGGARDLPGRQQTMRGAVQWSFDLLDDGERELLCRLAVFAGGCDYEAAEATCGAAGLDVLDGIASLVDKSLLRQREQEDGESRFRMLDLVREFALEQLDASAWAEEARGEHARYFLRIAEEAEPELVGPDRAAWFERLGREHDNLRAALSYLLDHSAEEGARLAEVLQHYWNMRSHFREGLGWIERALETRAAAPRVRMRLLIACAVMRRTLGDLDGAASCARESLALAREIGDHAAAVRALSELGGIAGTGSRLAEARAHLEEALALARAHDLRTLLHSVLANLGWIALEAKDFVAGARYIEQSLALHGHDWRNPAVANALMNLGEARFGLGEIEEARPCYRDALAMARQLGDAYGCALCLDGLAAVAVEDGRLESAAALAGAAEAHCEVLRVSLAPSSLAFRARYVEKLKASLEPEALEQAWARGRAMGLDAAVAEALHIA